VGEKTSAYIIFGGKARRKKATGKIKTDVSE
jgi:hypothetical protein